MNFDFVAKKYPVLAELNDDLRQHCDEGDLTDLALLKRFASAARTWVNIDKRSERLDWSYGETAVLEDSFHRYLNASRAFYRNWGLVLAGDGNWGQHQENIWRAEDRIDKYGPRVESELERIESEFETK
ncbi:MAG: hypothetical protein R6V57_11775 [Vicinamibacterales bacterium]